MVGRYATPDADTTIAHHLPPPEDDSTQDVSISFVIPPQADASNLLDQNYDDFFSGPGFVTLSTPIPPSRLTNAVQSARKVTGTIQPPAAISGSILGESPTISRITELELTDHPAETHIPSTSLSSLSQPAKPGPPPTASVLGTTSIVDPGPPRPSDVPPRSDPGGKFYNGPKPKTALSMASIVATKASGTQPDIQSMSTSGPSLHSTNTKNTQISRQPIAAPRKKMNGPAHSHGNTSVKSNQATSKIRGGVVLDRKTTTSVSCVELG